MERDWLLLCLRINHGGRLAKETLSAELISIKSTNCINVAQLQGNLPLVTNQCYVTTICRVKTFDECLLYAYKKLRNLHCCIGSKKILLFTFHWLFTVHPLAIFINFYLQSSLCNFLSNSGDRNEPALFWCIKIPVRLNGFLLNFRLNEEAMTNVFETMWKTSSFLQALRLSHSCSLTNFTKDFPVIKKVCRIFAGKILH